jgi:predicted XRE-type DNA-binding protein
MRPVRFLGDSLKCLRDFPEVGRHDAGYQLDKVQRGDLPRQTRRTSNRVLEIARTRFRQLLGGQAMSKPESYASVWDAIADTPEQAANLRARAELMQKIAALLRQHEWTQEEAARRCGVTQPRINDLLRGRVSRFSLDALVNIATALGCRVRVDLDAA